MVVAMIMAVVMVRSVKHIHVYRARLWISHVAVTLRSPMCESSVVGNMRAYQPQAIGPSKSELTFQSMSIGFSTAALILYHTQRLNLFLENGLKLYTLNNILEAVQLI